jgi:hypothetical protein
VTASALPKRLARDVPAPPLVPIALAIWGWLLLLHGWQAIVSGDPRLWLPHGVALLHDGAVLTFAAGLGLVARRFGWVLLAATGALLSIYPQMLREYLATPTNLFVADAESTRTLLTEYLGLGRLWPMLVVLLIFSVMWKRSHRFRVDIRVKIGIALVLAAAVLTFPRSPQPVISSLWLQGIELFCGGGRVVPSLRPAPAGSHFSEGDPPPAAIGNARFRHVFLIVLEGVPAVDFEREFMQRRDGFYDSVKAQATYFSNYYSTNLDSYTSLIAMLTGQQVPYRAYASPASYERVNAANNLPRTMRANGYHSLFLSTYGHQPFVPTKADWDEVLDRNDLRLDEHWLSLGSNRMEQATEDKAALATIVDTAVKHQRSFTLHEMVYGHSPEWQARTGKIPSVYYDEYLTELRDQLAVQGLIEESLIIVVSDHGDRARVADVDNYRVPLLVIGKSIKGATDSVLRSHLDLPAMTEHWLLNLPLPSERVQVDLVGSTERWVYGRLMADGQHLFVDDVRGRVLATSGKLDALVLRNEFQAKLDSFGRRFGR